ncbi:uracil-DNA glycosylase family protein [Epilithonimonas hominis]|uniref:Uracil-DNA glycosylase-like domain-containing protein n=1 Tax=Epilithonimonas hominis TaxID=420404 RepID=A0A1H6MHH2_9FLAO|nr:hypothetical protein [Epilithonimonas hominis]SEH97801.1 hypothetical protein SAMN05421793_1793 [Epilithonimonas hominis]
MACNHKFIRDLDLSYADWSVETLVVGTFNPEWSRSNNADWFYGRRTNNFWNVLPRIYLENELICSDKQTKLDFCRKHRIGITDLIKTINTASQEEHFNIISSFSDKAIEDNFKNDITQVNIIEILENKKTIRNVYLTRSAKNGMWRNLWKDIKSFCIDHEIYCTELLTPSNYAMYQYNKTEKQKYGSLEDFIYGRWKEKWKK